MIHHTVDALVLSVRRGERVVRVFLPYDYKWPVSAYRGQLISVSPGVHANSYVRE